MTEKESRKLEANIKEMLDVQYANTLARLGEVTGEEYHLTVEKLKTLHQQRMDLQKQALAVAVESEKVEIEKAKIDNDRERIATDRGGSLLTAGLKIASLVSTGVWLGRSLEFEKTGSYRSRSTGFLNGNTRLFETK